MLDDRLLLNPSQVKHLWFQWKQVEADSQGVTVRSMGRWEFVHIAQCRGFVTNGSNHWILRQPDQASVTKTMARGLKSYLWQPVISLVTLWSHLDQASKTEAMARGTEVLFMATSDLLVTP